MATKKHDLGVVTDLFQNGGQIRREFKLGRFLAVIEKKISCVASKSAPSKSVLANPLLANPSPYQIRTRC